jgi:membrane fusion protein, heavy metal efflux system
MSSRRAIWPLAVFAMLSCRRASDEGVGARIDAASPPAPSGSSHIDEHEHGKLPTRVRVDPAVVADAKIRTAPVTRGVLASAIELPGEVASDPDKTARISALVGGRIESVKFKEGDAVKKGDVLAVVKVPDLGKAKASFAATSAKAVSARSNANRLRALAEKRLAANQEVMAAEAEADALEAEAKAAEEQLRALGTGASTTVTGTQLVVRAPVGGVIVARDAVVGQPITSDQSIATIADLTEVWFLGRVFEKNLAQVRLDAPAEIRLNAYPEERFHGTVEYLGKQIDPTARTVVARIRLVNRDDLLRLGLFGVAQVGSGETSTRAPALLVPRDAVTEIGGKPVVFVSEPDGDFEVHEVVLGDGALGKVEVVSGLREGEQVVVDGVFTLKSVVLKSTLEEGE